MPAPLPSGMDRTDPRSDEGFTLIELLVAAAMMVVITAAAVAILTSVMRQQPKVTEGADQIGKARNALEKITADIREGVEVTSFSPSQLTLDTFCGADHTPCTVEISCGDAQPIGVICFRSIRGVSSAEIIRGLSSPDIFSGEGTSPVYVGVTIELPNEEGTRARTVLEGGAALHNSESYLG